MVRKGKVNKRSHNTFTSYEYHIFLPHCLIFNIQGIVSIIFTTSCSLVALPFFKPPKKKISGSHVACEISTISYIKNWTNTNTKDKFKISNLAFKDGIKSENAKIDNWWMNSIYNAQVLHVQNLWRSCPSHKVIGLTDLRYLEGWDWTLDLSKARQSTAIHLNSKWF